MIYFFVRIIRGLYTKTLLGVWRLKFLSYLAQFIDNKDVSISPLTKVYGNIYIRCFGQCEIKENVVFNSSTRFNRAGISKYCSIYVGKEAELLIGHNSGFSGVSIYCSEKIFIGDYCNFGVNVSIWDTDFHPLEFMARRIHDKTKIKSKSIIIGNDVFVGANSMILKGVEIGDRAVIGAGSVVTRDIPQDEIWAGNPAVFIRKVI